MNKNYNRRKGYWGASGSCFIPPMPTHKEVNDFTILCRKLLKQKEITQNAVINKLALILVKEGIFVNSLSRMDWKNICIIFDTYYKAKGNYKDLCEFYEYRTYIYKAIKNAK